MGGCPPIDQLSDCDLTFECSLRAFTSPEKEIPITVSMMIATSNSPISVPFVCPSRRDGLQRTPVLQRTLQQQTLR